MAQHSLQMILSSDTYSLISSNDMTGVGMEILAVACTGNPDRRGVYFSGNVHHRTTATSRGFQKRLILSSTEKSGLVTIQFQTYEQTDSSTTLLQLCLCTPPPPQDEDSKGMNHLDVVLSKLHNNNIDTFKNFKLHQVLSKSTVHLYYDISCICIDGSERWLQLGKPKECPGIHFSENAYSLIALKETDPGLPNLRLKIDMKDLILWPLQNSGDGSSISTIPVKKSACKMDIQYWAITWVVIAITLIVIVALVQCRRGK